MRMVLVLALLVVGAVVGCVAFYLAGPSPGPAAFRRHDHASHPTASSTPVRMAASPPVALGAAPDASCLESPAFAAAAAANGVSLMTAQWSVAGPPETGWQAYAPLAAREVHTDCEPDRTGFAAALAGWQGAHGLQATGIMDAGVLRAMNLAWLRRRPFIAATSGGVCPPPPPDDQLAELRPEESYAGKSVRLRVRALAAYRRLVAAAKADLPQLAADPRILTVFSGYRGPAEEKARCTQGAPCGTVAKARCSAHRTGMALDIFLTPSPGFAPASTDSANRIAQSQSQAYRWLVANANRFGFVPYPYEPWHWEFADGACDDVGGSCARPG